MQIWDVLEYQLYFHNFKTFLVFLGYLKSNIQYHFLKPCTSHCQTHLLLLHQSISATPTTLTLFHSISIKS